MSSSRRLGSCPACGALAVVPFFDGGTQPLATLSRPRSREEAAAVPRLPLDYVECVTCSHVFNASFDESKIPSAGAHPGWGMFNGAALWNDFMRGMAAKLASAVPDGALVVEIGHGGGEFIDMVAEARSSLRCLGFDPWGAERSGRPLLRREWIEPDALLALGPDLVIVRHVLEHLEAPRALLEKLAFAASRDSRIYVEVPCIDRAIRTGRTVDFFYEHAQQFTTASLSAMIERAGANVAEQGHGYDGEVVFALAEIGPGSARAKTAARIAREASGFDAKARAAKQAIEKQLAELLASGKRVAVWGGAGKGAAFIARYAMDAERFPIVVDSDPSKIGTFVAGAGQEIRDPRWLALNPTDVIVVPPQWRARDILLEMKAKSIRASVLIEHDGRLIDFERDPHPYEK